MAQNRQEKRFYNFLAASLVLHVIFLGSIGFLADASLFRHADVRSERAEKPLLFEFKSPQIVETPESARTEKPPENSQYISDKNARAQNENAPSELPVDQPFSTGIVERYERAEQPAPVAPLMSPEPPVAEEPGNRAVVLQQRDASAFSRDFLVRPEQFSAHAPGEVLRDRTDQRDSRAPDMGDFSINTYAWDFAPYMLRLKRRIERHIFPPPAFTYMGIISGHFVLRFRIMPDGTLAKLEVVSYNGHKSLLDTSIRAVEVSAPFEPLPGDFPEPYLEVTGRFDYMVHR